MADPQLLALLHGAIERSTTLTAELRTWHHQPRALSVLSSSHPVGPIGSMVHYTRPRGDVVETETVWRVARGIDGRDRWDEVTSTNDPTGIRQPAVHGCDGHRSWSVSADAVYIRPRHGSELDHRLFDPAWLLTHDLEVTGEAQASGRPVLRVHAVARPTRPRSGGPADLAPERDVLVDIERGFLHSDTALFNGEPYDIWELRDLVVDADIDPTFFEPVIPAGAKVFDYSAGPTPPSPWEMASRRRRWHVRWPIARW